MSNPLNKVAEDAKKRAEARVEETGGDPLALLNDLLELPHPEQPPEGDAEPV